METGGVLYHYTDFQALDGILQNAQLRVNNVLNMNDAAEMRHFMDRLCSAVAARLEEKELGEALRRLFREELKREFNYSAYAACFSYRRDDAAQWERYGNRGRGVCIAFREDYLKRMAKGALSLHRVFYRDGMDDHPLVEKFCNRLRQGGELGGEDPVLRKLMHDAWNCSVAFKHPSFSSEDETRLVVSPSENDAVHVKPCYHVTSERIKKYYPLDLTTMCRKIGIQLEDLVTELIIGPESTQSAPILQDYLCDNGLFRLAERVCLSDCPLRRPPL